MSTTSKRLDLLCWELFEIKLHRLAQIGERFACGLPLAGGAGGWILSDVAAFLGG